MQLEIRIATTTAEVNRGEWDRLSDKCPFASYDWYRMGETVLSPDSRWYVLIYDGGENIARAAFWLAKDEPLPLASPTERLAARALFKFRPLLICRSPLANWSGLILPDDDRRGKALELIFRGISEIAARQRVSFITFDFLEPQYLTVDWQSLGFSKVNVCEPGTFLQLPYFSFDDYLDGLSKHASKDYRRHTRQAEARGIDVSIEDRVTDPEGALRLIRSVESKHNSMPIPWARAMLEHASRGGFSWVSAHRGGRLVGCGLILEDQQVHLAALLGLDLQEQYVYFQLMYAAIRNAINYKAVALRAGSGAYAFKQRLGFQLEDNHHMVFSGCGSFFQRLGEKLGQKY